MLDDILTTKLRHTDMKTQNGLRPCDCESITDILALERSYQEVGGRYGMLIQDDGAVILTNHVPGQPQTGSATIPRRHFQRLIEWYQTEQPNHQTSSEAKTP